MRIKDVDITSAHTRLIFFPLVCRQTYTHTLTHTHMHKHRHTRMHGHTYTHKHIHTHKQTCRYPQAHAQMRAPQETEELLCFWSH